MIASFFLIGAYWAQIDLLRKSVSSVVLFEDGRGTKLHAYLDCLESPEVRLFDRMQQRAIGEAFTTEGGQVIGYTAFFDAMRKDTIKHPWMIRLRQFVVKLDHKSERQRLLQYATVVHSMLDELDPFHKFSRNRPAMPNKLSSRTWNSLNYRVFGKYLTFVRGRQKYLGPPKKSGPKGVGKTN